MYITYIHYIYSISIFTIYISCTIYKIQQNSNKTDFSLVKPCPE